MGEFRGQFSALLMSAPRQSGHRQEAAASGTGSMAGRSTAPAAARPAARAATEGRAALRTGPVRCGPAGGQPLKDRLRSGVVMPDQRLISSRVRRRLRAGSGGWHRHGGSRCREAGRDMARGGGEQRGAHCSGHAGGYPSACTFRGSGRQAFQRQPQAERHETDAHQVTDQHRRTPCCPARQ